MAAIPPGAGWIQRVPDSLRQSAREQREPLALLVSKPRALQFVSTRLLCQSSFGRILHGLVASVKPQDSRYIVSNGAEHCWRQCRLVTKPSRVLTKCLRLSTSAVPSSADPLSLALRARMSSLALKNAGVLSSRSVIAIFNCCIASAFRTSAETAPLGSAERPVFKSS